MRKVVAFDQQRIPHRFREGVGETVAKIQLGRMAAASLEIAIGGAGDIGPFPGYGSAVISV
jgi:hypothetical protein